MNLCDSSAKKKSKFSSNVSLFLSHTHRITIINLPFFCIKSLSKKDNKKFIDQYPFEANLSHDQVSEAYW